MQVVPKLSGIIARMSRSGVLCRLARLALLALPLSLGACDEPFSPPRPDRAAIAAAQAEIAASAPPRANARSLAEDRAMLQSVAQRLARAAQPFCRAELGRDCAFRIALVEAREANAYASGRDDIAVTTGMMRLLANEDELAAVVAHEMAHHIAGHIAEGTLRTQAGAMAGSLIGAVAGGVMRETLGVDVGLSRLGAQAGATAGRLTYSKTDEREADYLGAHIMARAGFDLDRGAGLWAKLTALSGHERTALLDTHPAGPERLAAWRRTAEEIRANPEAPPRRDR